MKIDLNCFNPNGTGLFLTCLGLGGGCRPLPPPLSSSLFVDLLQPNFVQGLTIKALTQIWKNLHEINDVITVRNLAETTVKRVYFKIAAVSSFLFNPAETLQKH